VVYVCRHCYLQFTEHSFDDIRAYYQNEYREKYDIVAGERVTSEDRYCAMRPLMRDSSNRIKAFLPPGSSVLEIGCSSGYMLDAIGDTYDRYGLEWNPEDAAFVRDVGELRCEESTIEDCYPGQQFNAIVAMQVLEHQTDPVAFLKQCKSRLIGGGYLYLETPHAMDFMVTVAQCADYRDFWYREPHITYWTRETLASALGALGFEAHIKNYQRYGLINHANWQMNGVPMQNVQEAQEYWQPIPTNHPLAGVLNRGISNLDKQYRVLMASYGCGDTLFALARRREI
jgi:2-polyprenyl-3-methyl-5-hydroxy-6-metoxy-1,4-benzoquinol methylase